MKESVFREMSNIIALKCARFNQIYPVKNCPSYLTETASGAIWRFCVCMKCATLCSKQGLELTSFVTGETTLPPSANAKVFIL